MNNIYKTCESCPLRLYEEAVVYTGTGTRDKGVLIVLPYYTDRAFRQLEISWNSYGDVIGHQDTDLRNDVYISVLSRCSNGKGLQRILDDSCKICAPNIINEICVHKPKYIILVGQVCSILSNKYSTKVAGKFKLTVLNTVYYIESTSSKYFTNQLHAVLDHILDRDTSKLTQIK